jgi:protein-tyrosine-phosphatase
VLPVVRDYLHTRGIDVSAHRRRTLLPAMLDEADLVVAMSTEHQRELAERFGRPDVPLFTELAGYPGEPLPDVDEAVPDFRENVAAARRHVHRTIDRILMLAPAFVARLEEGR